MAAGVLLDQYADLRNEGAPATPGSGWTRAYTKTDNGLYLKDSGGTERKVVTGDDARLLQPSVKAGIAQSSDAAISAVSVSGGGSDPTVIFTLSTAEPLCVQGSPAGPAGLTMLHFAGGTTTFHSGGYAISTYPTYAAWAIEVDTTGTVQIVEATGLSAAAAAAALPAAATGRLRLYIVTIVKTSASTGVPWAWSNTVDVRPQAQYAGSTAGANLQTAARMYRSGSSSVFSTPTGAFGKIPVDTASFDPGGNFQAANGRYVCPVAGYYQVNGQVIANVTTFNTSIWFEAGIYVNGASVSWGLRASDSDAQGYTTGLVSDIIYCQAGDYIELWAGGNGGWALAQSPQNNHLSVVLVGNVGSPTPGQGIQTTARAWCASSAQVFLTGASARVNLDTLTFDPGANVSLTNHRYVAPVTGYYQVNGQVLFNTAVGVTPAGAVLVMKNGVTELARGGMQYDSASNVYLGMQVSDIVYLQAGDYIELWLLNTSGASISLATGAAWNYLSAVQVGGTNLIGALSPLAAIADYTAGPGQCVLMTGTHAVALPSAPMAGSQVEVVALTGTVTINRSGADTINMFGVGGITSMSIAVGWVAGFRYLGGVWYQVSERRPPLQTGWSAAPALLNSWAIAFTGLNNDPGYIKDENGFMHFKGRIKSGASGTVAFVVPAGSRPRSTYETFPLVAFNSATPVAAAAAVDPTSGNVTIWFASAITDVSLTGLTYLAEN